MASYRPTPPQHAYSASSSSSLAGGGGGAGGRYVPYASAAPGASSSSGSDMMSPPGSARNLPSSPALGRQNGSQSSQRGYAQQPYPSSSGGLSRTTGSQSSQQSRGGPGGSVDYPTIHGAHDDEQMRVRRPRPDTEEIKRVGRTHYQELLGFLRSHLQKGEHRRARSARRPR